MGVFSDRLILFRTQITGQVIPLNPRPRQLYLEQSGLLRDSNTAPYLGLKPVVKRSTPGDLLIPILSCYQI